MSHSINPPRNDLTHAVVGDDGYVMSWHRTEAAALRAIDAEWRRFRRAYPADGSHGNATAYLPRSIIHCAGGSREIERTGRHSTSWREL